MNLSALKAATAATAPRTSGVSPYHQIELHLIYANPDQPRKHFDAEALRELADSIEANGLIQPISVVRRGTRYMIVAGERRYRAHQIIGARTIRAIVAEEMSDIDENALIENIQREDLSDFEIAKAIGKLWDSGKYPLKQDLARAIAKPQSYVSKALGCLRLDESIRADIEASHPHIGLTVLEEIARMDDPSDQRRAYDGYVSGEMKRKDFKEITTREPKPREISPGKKEKTSFEIEGHKVILTLGDYIRTSGFGIYGGRKYKITIEEV